MSILQQLVEGQGRLKAQDLLGVDSQYALQGGGRKKERKEECLFLGDLELYPSRVVPLQTSEKTQEGGSRSGIGTEKDLGMKHKHC